MSLKFALYLLGFILSVFAAWELKARAEAKRSALENQLPRKRLNATLMREGEEPMYATIRELGNSVVLKIYANEVALEGLKLEQVFLSIEKLEEYLENETIFRIADFTRT